MTSPKISINRVVFGIGGGAVISVTILIFVLWLMFQSVVVVICGLLLALILFFWIILFIVMVRKKLELFTTSICQTLDDMMSGNPCLRNDSEEETAFIKISHSLNRLYSIMLESKNQAAEERIKLQALISDISHQVKTPIANLKMVNELLLEQDMPEDKRHELLQAMGGQLDKLDFLMQAMIKTSRLEAGVVVLAKTNSHIYETLAAALGGILLNAEKKRITVAVDCSEDLVIPHDIKWTGEALFNILDNAVKYTLEGGDIQVKVEQWEFYTKIDVIDNGRGISESNHAKIFKRFYREKEVHDIEGIGIGLYLAREIITMQGGYIKVTSEANKGSIFSVFLPNRV